MKYTILLFIAAFTLIALPMGCASTISGFKSDTKRNYQYTKDALYSKPIPRPLAR